MKRLLTLAAVMAMTISLWAQSGLDKTASEIIGEMSPGINLGNTLEATTSWTGGALWNNKGGLNTETGWQGTRTTQAVIDYMKSLGFRSVRIPCAWAFGHISNASTYTIDQAWMNRVKEVVDYCINDGMYVVLNDHWDGGWIQGTFKTDISEPTVAANCEKMKKLWTQIAETFKDYDEHLLYAGLNEPEAEKEDQIKVLMTYEQAFIDAVRATGGNNASRTLVVQGPNTSIELSSQYVDMSKFEDTASKALMIEVHYYSPPQFTGVWEGPNGDEPYYFWGAANHVPSGTYKKYNCTWGEEAYVREQFQMMKEAFVDKGYPVILGEYGANWREFSNNSIQKKHDASLWLFHKTINEEAIKRGIIPYVWDINNPNRYGTGGIMCIIDRSKPAVFDTNSLDGIMSGAAAATWGGPATCINRVEVNQGDKSSAPVIYDLQGRKVKNVRGGLYIIGGKLVYSHPNR